MSATRRARRILIVAAALAGVVLLVVALLPEPVPVDLGTVDRGPLAVVVRHEGRTQVTARFEIAAPVGGTVGRIDLRPGDAVAAGRTVLATIRPLPASPLDERTRRDAEAGVRAAEADLERAAAERDRLAAEAEFAAAEERRLATLFADGVVAERDLDQARTAARTARQALAAAGAALVQA
ncbi:MAG: efflux transporter periplasmic adaptor subunit, partial [Acidobacteria bacterium]